jgi:hypothetical protein
MTTPFEKFIALSPDGRKRVREIIDCCFLLNGKSFVDWTNDAIVEHKLLCLLHDPLEKIDEEDEPAVKWHVGAFMVSFNMVPFLVTTMGIRAAFVGNEMSNSITDINRRLLAYGMKMCHRKLADEIFQRTVFAKFGNEAQRQMRFWHIPKRMNWMKDPIHKIKPCLCAPLEGDKVD